MFEGRTKIPNKRIYIPFREKSGGVIGLWKEMFTEIVTSRELIWQLFRRDLVAAYKQSYLGILWAVIMPLAMVSAFIFLNRSGLINIGSTNVPYPVFALSGLIIWQLFASGLVLCANSLILGGGMITKINFPRESIIVAAFGQSVFEFIVRAALLAAVFLIYGVSPAWTAVFLPFALIPLLLLTLGLGLVFSLLNGLMRDFGNALSLAVTFLLFLSPVLYPLPASRLFATVNRYNLPGILVSSAREILVSGSISQPLLFAAACVFSILIFIAAWTLFHLAEPIVSEKL